MTRGSKCLQIYITIIYGIADCRKIFCLFDSRLLTAEVCIRQLLIALVYLVYISLVAVSLVDSAQFNNKQSLTSCSRGIVRGVYVMTYPINCPFAIHPCPIVRSEEVFTTSDNSRLGLAVVYCPLCVRSNGQSIGSPQRMTMGLIFRAAFKGRLL